MNPLLLQSVDAYVTFSPDFNSKNILVASESTRHLSLFKVKRCGQERTLLEEPLADAANRESLGRHLAVNMHQGEVLFVVTDEHRLFKVRKNVVLLQLELGSGEDGVSD